MAKKQNLIINRGETFTYFVRWETVPIVYKPISNISQSAPAVIEALNHGVPDGWRVAVVSAKGMRQINALNTPPKDKDFRTATVLSANTVQLNEVNSADYSAYTSGGFLQYNTPKDLTGYTAKLTIRNKAGGTVLLEMTSANGKALVDVVGNSIKLSLTSTDTSALTWKTGVYELELTSSLGEVTALMSGSVNVTDQ